MVGYDYFVHKSIRCPLLVGQIENSDGIAGKLELKMLEICQILVFNVCKEYLAGRKAILIRVDENGDVCSFLRSHQTMSHTIYVRQSMGYPARYQVNVCSFIGVHELNHARFFHQHALVPAHVEPRARREERLEMSFVVLFLQHWRDFERVRKDKSALNIVKSILSLRKVEE